MSHTGQLWSTWPESFPCPVIGRVRRSPMYTNQTKIKNWYGSCGWLPSPLAVVCDHHPESGIIRSRCLHFLVFFVTFLFIYLFFPPRNIGTLCNYQSSYKGQSFRKYSGIRVFKIPWWTSRSYTTGLIMVRRSRFCP